MREYFFMYVVEYHALTRIEYARIFYYRDLWYTLPFPPNTTIIYLMISCEGELRNGTKYAELAYLLPISGNSGVQSVWLIGVSSWTHNMGPQLGEANSFFLY